ncbi:MAG: AmmeMemoRadiSam system protein B [bacterium]|nr:AmmeMemoRadiSam system protein B [bacterium]
MKFKVIALLVLLIFLGLSVYFFYSKGLPSQKTAFSETEKSIKGIVLPHHNLAGQLTSQALEKLSKNQTYETIVILSPNHFHPDSPLLTTSEEIKGYSIDERLVKQMTEKIPTVRIDKAVIEKEHGLTNVLAYLENYFPGAKFLPLAVSPHYTPEEIEQITSFLAEKLPLQTLFVASLDFSHEEMLLTALEKNKETIEVIKNFDYQTLYRFKDDHLDSPLAVVIFLRVIEKLSGGNWETWDNTHGSVLIDDPTLQGTSYVIGIFR